MKEKTFYYLPRIIAALFVIFIGFFALDIFTDEYITPNIYLAILINLTPNFIFFLALLYAWKHEKTGGFLLIALFFLGLLFFKNPFPTNIILFAPLLIAGVLLEYHLAILPKRLRRRYI